MLLAATQEQEQTNKTKKEHEEKQHEINDKTQYEQSTRNNCGINKSE